MEGPQLFPLATDTRAFDIGLIGALASIIYLCLPFLVKLTFPDMLMKGMVLQPISGMTDMFNVVCCILKCGVCLSELEESYWLSGIA